MKKPGLGTQELSMLIKSNCIYVDKTEIINKLIENGRYYFLSRPRRFGKSLLVNTMKELFTGNKELFQDTWIYDKWNFDEKYPVIQIDFSKLDYGVRGLDAVIQKRLKTISSDYNVYLKSTTVKEQFEELIEELGKKTPVVILIDEYDKPIIDYVESTKREKAEENREILRNFYSVIKSSDKYIKLLFITGISKFSKVSLFSELNNLTDITFNPKYVNIAGYTKQEIIDNYSYYLEIIKEKFNWDDKTLFESIKLWYNGYSWDGKNFVYNPYSILNLFESETFGNYWFQSGTPRFLTKLIREREIDFVKYEKSFELDANALDSYDIDNIDSSVILFQAGYLTVKNKNIDPEYFSESYVLAYPNKEVRDSFYNHLTGEFTGLEKTSFFELVKKLNGLLENNDFDKFMLELQNIYANISHSIFIKERESYYHTVAFLILKLMRADIIEIEQMTNHGRVDVAVSTKNTVYIIEFKMNSVNSALNQIKNKKYFEPYLNTGKNIVCAGVAFDKEKRNISEYKALNLDELLSSEIN